MRNSVYKGHKGTVRSIAWSINGNKIASGSEDHTVQIWSAFNPSLIYKYQNHSNWVFGLAWSQPDETLIASGSYDKTVQVWQAV